MSTDDQRIAFINMNMNMVHNLCDELYEALMDEDLNDVSRIACDIQDIIKDIKQTFKNEI